MKNDDLTLLYYTANLLPPGFAKAVRQHHLSHGITIVSVSQKPIEFGYATRLCVGEIGASIYNCYRQILAAAQEAETPWVACIEDDTVYPTGFFSWRPPDERTFGYGLRWNLNRDGRFFFRNRTGMGTCITSRSLLVSTLQTRFATYPEAPKTRLGYIYWGEPGRFEARLGLPPVEKVTFETDPMPVVFNHRPSLGGVRRLLSTDKLCGDLPYWGQGKKMLETFRA